MFGNIVCGPLKVLKEQSSSCLVLLQKLLYWILFHCVENVYIMCLHWQKSPSSPPRRVCVTMWSTQNSLFNYFWLYSVFLSLFNTNQGAHWFCSVIICLLVPIGLHVFMCFCFLMYLIAQDGRWEVPCFPACAGLLVCRLCLWLLQLIYLNIGKGRLCLCTLRALLWTFFMSFFSLVGLFAVMPSPQHTTA